MGRKLVYIIAGEPSGDILGSRLMMAMHQQESGLEFIGVGGETMAEMGVKSLFDISEISVMGVLEVIPKLKSILARVRQVSADIIDRQPDVIVTIDSWGFVDQVLSRLKRIGCKIPKVHYVAPQVWAWKKGRAKKVPKLVDELMTLLPMEPPYFEKYGLHCTFVGHPVIENTANLPDEPTAFKARYNIPSDSTLLTVLPGSRQSEIKRLIPVFKEVLRQIKVIYPDLFLVIPSVNSVAQEVERNFADAGFPYRVILGQNERYASFKASQFALAASGTVSLELTACGTSHVIAYKFGGLTNAFLKHFAGTRYANLINILADRFIIPEFVLENCQADLITPVVVEMIQSPTLRKEQIEQATEYLHQLKPKDMMPSQKAASVVLGLLK